MRTNIVLDEALVAEAMRYAPVKSKQELVELALNKFVANRRRRDMREFFGSVEIDPDYDYKARRIGASGPEREGALTRCPRVPDRYIDADRQPAAGGHPTGPLRRGADRT